MFEGGTPAAAADDGDYAVPSGGSTCHCLQQRYQSRSSNNNDDMAKIGLPGRPRPPTPPEAGNADDVLHSYRSAVNNDCLHRCCDDDEPGKDWAEAPSRDGHARAASTASVTAMAAAEVEVAAAAAEATPSAAAATADGDTIMGDELGGSGGRLSWAAVEAWEAAETWASALAAATGAVVAGRGRPSVAEAMEGTVGNDKGGGTVELGPTAAGALECHHRRQNRCVMNAERPVERGWSNDCRCSFSGDPGAKIGIRRSTMHRRDSILSCDNSSVPGEICQSTVHRRDSVLYNSSKVPIGGAALQSGGCGRPAVNSARRNGASTCSRHEPTARTAARNDDDDVFTARAFDDPRRGKTSPTAVVADPTTARPVVLVGEAAAVVLARINRGEELWVRRARRAGLAALRARRTRAGLRHARGAMAAEYSKNTLRNRGLRVLGAGVKRKKDRAKDAATAAAADAAACATADAFTRAHGIHRVVAMLQR